MTGFVHLYEINIKVLEKFVLQFEVKEDRFILYFISIQLC